MPIDGIAYRWEFTRKELKKEDRERLRETFDSLMDDPHITFWICPICGRLDFQSSRTKKLENIPESITFDDRPDYCVDCMDVARRAPEVFRCAITAIKYSTWINLRK